MQPGLDGADRNANKLMNFLEFIAFRVMQQHDDTVLVAELGQCGIEPLPGFVALGFGIRVAAAGEFVESVGEMRLIDAVQPLTLKPAVIVELASKSGSSPSCFWSLSCSAARS